MSRVVLALTREQDDRFAFARLVEAGAAVLAVPLLRRVARPPALLRGVLVAGSFTDLLVTSASSVAALEAAGAASGALRSVPAFAVGLETARRLAGLLGRPEAEVVAARDAAALLARITAAGDGGLAGRRFLFPASEAALRTLPDGLRALGAEVDEVTCYATEAAPEGSRRVADALAAGVSLWTVASPTAVRALAAGLDASARPRSTAEVAAIGPTTAAAARAAGLKVAVEASVHTMAGLADAVERYLRI